MWHPFDPPMDPIPSQNTQTRQKEPKERRHRSLPMRIFSRIVIAILVTLGFSYWMAWDAKEPLTEEPGRIQDGVYYLYKGSALTKAPGLYAYTPGQEPEVLVSAKEYHLNTTVPFWGVNERGLYFIDNGTDSIYRMDLDTQEISQLYTRTAEAYQTDLSLTALYLYEDHIVLQRRMGQTTDYLTLDCATGQVLNQSKEPPQEPTDPQPGTAAYEVQRLGLPATKEDIFYTYLDVADQWLFYTSHQKDPTPNVTKFYTELRAMDLNTQESHLVSTEYDPYFAVTDGNWFYSYGDYTNCYQLEYNGQGIPCGLTLIEKDI